MVNSYNLPQGKRDMKLTCTKLFFIFAFLIPLAAFSRDHLIYSVGEELPMGEENEITKKNYYLNIGSNQGVSEGTILDVYRVISKMNPYDNKKRINYKVKVGELKVIHSEDEASIGITELLKTDIPTTPMFDISNFMIGDHINVKVN